MKDTERGREIAALRNRARRPQPKRRGGRGEQNRRAVERSRRGE